MVLEKNTVFPQIDARVFISFTTPRTQRFKRGWRLFVFLTHAHPHYVAHAKVKIPSVCATVWQAKGVTGILNSLLLEGHVEASLLCHRSSSR